MLGFIFQKDSSDPCFCGQPNLTRFSLNNINFLLLVHSNITDWAKDITRQPIHSHPTISFELSPRSHDISSCSTCISCKFITSSLASSHKNHPPPDYHNSLDWISSIREQWWAKLRMGQFEVQSRFHSNGEHNPFSKSCCHKAASVLTYSMFDQHWQPGKLERVEFCQNAALEVLSWCTIVIFVIIFSF